MCPNSSFSSCKTETLYQLNPISPPSPSPWPPPLYFVCLWLHRVPHLSGTIQYLPFGDWLISLSTMSSKLTHILHVLEFLFFNFKPEWYSLACVWHILFIQSSVGGRWIASTLGAANNAMNMGIQISLQQLIFKKFVSSYLCKDSPRIPTQNTSETK